MVRFLDPQRLTLRARIQDEEFIRLKVGHKVHPTHMWLRVFVTCLWRCSSRPGLLLPGVRTVATDLELRGLSQKLRVSHFSYANIGLNITFASPLTSPYDTTNTLGRIFQASERIDLRRH